MPRRNHSVAEFTNNANYSPVMMNPFMIPVAHGTPNSGYHAFVPQMSPIMPVTNPKLL